MRKMQKQEYNGKERNEGVATMGSEGQRGDGQHEWKKMKRYRQRRGVRVEDGKRT
jgi:hypothetical protein